MGQRCNNTPVINNKEIDVKLRHKWETIQAGRQPTLTERKKWLSLNTNLKRGNLVLLCDKSLKQSHWSLGRIVEALPETDMAVCVVKVQTKDSGYVRSVASLLLLECSNDRVGAV